MKKLLIAMTLVLSVFFMASCGTKNKSIKIGVSFEPIISMIRQLEPELKKQGYFIEIVHEDYNLSNKTLSNGGTDLNIVQHKHFMNTYNASLSDQKNKLELVQAVYYPRLGLHSKTAKKVDDIKAGTTIIIPNDPDNLARALLFLQDLKLIELNEGVTLKAKVSDIKVNSKNLVFREETLGTSSSAYHSFKGEVAAVLYPSYARLVDNSLMKDTELVVREELTDRIKDYGISVVTKTGNKDSKKIKDFIDILTKSSVVKNWYKDNYSFAGDLAF